eukprot:2164422-Rhodomonas_salina.1
MVRLLSGRDSTSFVPPPASTRSWQNLVHRDDKGREQTVVVHCDVVVPVQGRRGNLRCGITRQQATALVEHHHDALTRPLPVSEFGGWVHRQLMGHVEGTDCTEGGVRGKRQARAEGKGRRALQGAEGRSERDG